MAVSQRKKNSDIIRLWQNLNKTEEIDYPSIIKWAITQNLYDKEPPTLEEMLEADLRRAVKNATHIDPQGRKIRTYGVPRVLIENEVFTLAPVDMRYAKPEIAETVQDANFKGIVSDVKRHSIETQSYNDNNPYQATLPLYDYCMTKHAEAALAAGTYDDSFDEDSFDEEQGDGD